jgi:hypothetical protein
MPSKLFVTASMRIAAPILCVPRLHCAAKVVVETSSRGWAGKGRPAHLPAIHEEIPGFDGLVVTVTPTARPFCTAAQMLTPMCRGRRRR